MPRLMIDVSLSNLLSACPKLHLPWYQEKKKHENLPELGNDRGAK